jgi:hypothetical protein
MLRSFILMLFAFGSAAAAANCPPRTFNYPSDLELEEESALVVTHASSNFDARYATKYGVDNAVDFARNRRMPVLYLEDDDAPSSYFAEECAPDYRVFSEDGELPIEIRSREVYVVGGHIELCLGRTLQDIVASWARRPTAHLKLTFFMDGIYSNGKSIRDSDPYAKAVDGFLKIVSHGRGGRETWSKLTLLETLALIPGNEQRYDYLRRVLPNYESLPSNYRVELQLNDEPPRLLRQGNQRSNMRLQFRFVDTAPD